MPISNLPFITNHPPFNFLWREGAWRKGYIYHVAPDRALDFTTLSDLSQCTNTAASRRIYFLLLSTTLAFSRIPHSEATLPFLPRLRSAHIVAIPQSAFLLPFETSARLMKQFEWAHGNVESHNTSYDSSSSMNRERNHSETQILLTLLPTSCPPYKLATFFPVVSILRTTPSSPFRNTPAPLRRQITCSVECRVCGAIVLT